jgi:hypothetical protein
MLAKDELTGFLAGRSRSRGVQSLEELAELDAFVLAERSQESSLLFVKDPDRRPLGGTASVRRADEEGPPVPRMPVPDR